MLRHAALLIPLLLLAAAPPARASVCPQHHPGGLSPQPLRPALAERTRELCFREFAVLHSGVARAPLAASEHLTAARLRAARALERDGAFHEERRLPEAERARLSDYARSGFDRGHMAPAGDMATAGGQAESFSLANVAPQHPESNRCLWAAIEEATRDLAEAEGEVWVVTGPLFEGAELEELQGRVPVPTGFFKALYRPARGEAAAFLAPNGPGAGWRAASLEELAALSGLAVFPTLPADLRARIGDLPRPAPPRGACARGEAAAQPPPPAPGQAARGLDPVAWIIGLAILAVAALLVQGCRR